MDAPVHVRQGHGDGWFAEAVEVDCFAQGNTVYQAKRNFEEGLLSTARLYRKQGDPNTFLKSDSDYLTAARKWMEYEKGEVETVRFTRKARDLISIFGFQFYGLEYRVQKDQEDQ